MTVVEICVDDVAGARIADRAGADRVELCAALSEGGITPSIGLTTTVLAAVSHVGVQVLIRPRGGNFVYDDDELDVMCRDINAITALPTTVPVGFVLNALTPDGHVHRPAMRRLVEATHGAPTTFSRAFDAVRDPSAAYTALTELGIGRILTAGGPGTADEGSHHLRALVARTGPTVLAAGHIRAATAAQLVAATGVTEIHLRATRGADTATSAAEVHDVLAAVRAMP